MNAQRAGDWAGYGEQIRLLGRALSDMRMAEQRQGAPAATPPKSTVAKDESASTTSASISARQLRGVGAALAALPGAPCCGARILTRLLTTIGEVLHAAYHSRVRRRWRRASSSRPRALRAQEPVWRPFTGPHAGRAERPSCATALASAWEPSSATTAVCGGSDADGAGGRSGGPEHRARSASAPWPGSRSSNSARASGTGSTTASASRRISASAAKTTFSVMMSVPAVRADVHRRRSAISATRRSTCGPMPAAGIRLMRTDIGEFSDTDRAPGWRRRRRVRIPGRATAQGQCRTEHLDRPRLRGFQLRQRARHPAAPAVGAAALFLLSDGTGTPESPTRRRAGAIDARPTASGYRTLHLDGARRRTRGA